MPLRVPTQRVVRGRQPVARTAPGEPWPPAARLRLTAVDVRELTTAMRRLPAAPPPEMKDSVRIGLEHLAHFHGAVNGDYWLLAPADVPVMTGNGFLPMTPHSRRICAIALSTPTWYAARAPPPVSTNPVNTGMSEFSLPFAIIVRRHPALRTLGPAR